MKVALVWPEDVPLAAISFRFEHYLTGFRTLGHEVILVAGKGLGQDFPHPITEAEPEDFVAPDFWRQLALDVAIVLTWHRFSALLGTFRGVGTQVVAISDSDGLVGLRSHPWMVFQRMWFYQRTLRDRLRCLHYFLDRYFNDGRRGAPEDREFLASTHNSDAVVFGSEPAVDAFRDFLRFHGEEEALAHRLRVVPYAVPEAFVRHPIPERKEPSLVALARWSDPQKNAGLLAQALGRFLPHHPEAEVEIFGRDGEPFFADLADRFPNFHLRGPQPPPRVLESLLKCRIVLFSSRWETGPHAATEALALGATLVSTPFPNAVGLAADGRFGTVARQHRARSLAEALQEEWTQWEDGQRNPQDIAEYWRPRLSPEIICRQLLEALPGNPETGIATQKSAKLSP